MNRLNREYSPKKVDNNLQEKLPMLRKPKERNYLSGEKACISFSINEFLQKGS